MDQILDENEQHMQDLDENTKQVGLYKVIFEINDQQRTIDLLLTTKKKKKKDIKQMIAIKMKRKLKEIKRLNSDLENTFKDIQVVWMGPKRFLN
jgi:Tfp pilus assembly protein PilN